MNRARNVAVYTENDLVDLVEGRGAELDQRRINL